MSDTRLLPALSPSDARQVDQACDRFESAWKAGRRPRLEEYVAATSEPVRSALLRQLLLLDWDYHRRAGDEPSADDYHARFPRDATLIGQVGREMADSPSDTGEWADDSRARPTPWAGGPSAGPAPEADAPRYDLVHEVGHGGIGVVYRSRDRILGRELAVKVLRDAHRDKPDACHRFIAEARIGSQLQHPAIVPVYEMGQFADGRPYFTMKLVEGQTLAELLRGRTEPHHDWPRLLGVFEQVCQAMAYAHARGVIHRDLKPANVMVGAFGEVQVMDWGFAKVLGGDATAPPDGADTIVSPVSGGDGVTQSGTLMGTPAYMSPEQARGQAALVDPRADVFALGAILCEILTGRPPYRGETAEEICPRAADGDVAEAYGRLDGCGADATLRDLAKRCLSAHRDARPANAGVVAQDLTAYLASAQERLRQAQLDQTAAEARAEEAAAKSKAERRARRLTLALAAALLCGTAVAVWQAAVATRAATAQRAAKETANAKEAETRAVLDFVQSRLIAAAQPEGYEGGLGREVTLRKALEAALSSVEKSFAHQPLTEARLRITLGEAFHSLDEAAIAAEQFRRARAIFTEHLGPTHPDTVESMDKLASSYARLGQHDDALKLREEALALNKATLEAGHTNTLEAMNNLANSYADLGRHDDALRLRTELLPLVTAKFGADHPRTLAGMSNLASSYYARGRHTDALELREAGLRLRKVNPGPNHPDTLQAMTDLATSYYALSRYPDAIKLFRETLELQEAKLGPYNHFTLTTMNNLAGVYQARGQFTDALPLLEVVLARRKDRLAHDHPKLLSSMNNLATCYAALNRHEEAFKYREETLALCKAKLPPGHPQTLMGMTNLAFSYTDLNRHAEALELRQETLTLKKRYLGPDHPHTLGSMADLAASLVQLDRGAEALPIIDDCLRRAASKVVDPNMIQFTVDLRLRVFEKAKDVHGCRATAEMWEKQRRSDADSLYSAACFRAVTAKVLRATDPSAEAAREADTETERAMAWLTQAVAAGYKDAANMKKDADFDGLRDRADFQKLLAAVQAGGD